MYTIAKYIPTGEYHVFLKNDSICGKAVLSNSNDKTTEKDRDKVRLQLYMNAEDSCGTCVSHFYGKKRS